MENTKVIQPRRSGFINLRGFWAVFSREVGRFSASYLQTILAPVLLTCLFCAIFSRGQVSLSLLAGLVMMAVLQNAFIQPASSLMIMKRNGTLSDLLRAPLSSCAVVLGFVFAGIARVLFISAFTVGVMIFFVPPEVADARLAVFFFFGAATVMALIGFMAGLGLQKPDHLAAVQNFIVIPLTFLSGVFFAPQDLAEGIKPLLLYNPLFFVIDGFRYGIMGQSETSVTIGVVGVSVVALAFLVASCHIFNSKHQSNG